MISVFFALCICVKSGYSLFDLPFQTQPIKQATVDAFNSLTADDYRNFEGQGLRSHTQLERLENVIKDYKITIKEGSISHAQLLERFPDESSQRINQLAQQLLKTTSSIVNSYCLPNNIPTNECIAFLESKNLPTDSELYKSCQSIGHKFHGFRRLLPANYKDGIHQMKKTGLPNPLKISELASNNRSTKEDKDKNLAFIQWAQFIEHDLVKGVVTLMHNYEAIECCDSEYFSLLPRYRHPACEPLEGLNPRENTIDRKTCLNYVRSSLAVNEGCRLGVASQLNLASSELDLSQLYGFTKGSQARMKRKGFLRSNGEFLPYADAEDRAEFCVTDTKECYMAGDNRVNSNPYTIILYTLFLRNHNRIARELMNENTLLSEDEIFEKAKEQNIKVYRDIVFNEWLPLLLGSDAMGKLGEEKLRKQRDEKLRVSNEFGVAAARFYSSMIPTKQKEVDGATAFNLHDEFYTSSSLDTNFDNRIQGILKQKSSAMDSAYSHSLLKRYFSTESSKSYVSGADALGWDIQIGRDHGLQGYTEYVKACSGVKIKKWSDLSLVLDEDEITKLKSVYDKVEDIDLIIGGIAERKDADSTVGPTFNCISSEQYSKLRQLHYNLHGEDLIRSPPKSSCNLGAALICRTTELVSVPRNIFMSPSGSNELIFCTEVLKSCKTTNHTLNYH